MNFLTVDYLLKGTQTQIAAFHALKDSQTLEKLSRYCPVLIGTIPINIDIPGSDIDIACYWRDPFEFINTLNREFHEFEGFRVSSKDQKTKKSIVARFRFGGFDFEIFGQSTPVTEQMGYRHMIIEHRLLEEKGEAFRQAIIALKKSGMKTEPAFARLLDIDGDPYEGLLIYEKL